jgi:hypothetical protein
VAERISVNKQGEALKADRRVGVVGGLTPGVQGINISKMRVEGSECRTHAR